jgi:protein-S-isoprenylcysteine O-methyltransferase Ste14
VTHDVALALRALLFLILLPGTVAGYIPLRIVATRRVGLSVDLSAGSIAATCLIILGVYVLLRCVWDFFAFGRGTLAPLDPPKHLVVKGLYRFTRNPMYNGVLAVLLGEAWLFRSTSLLQYAAAVFVGFNVFVLVYEEPALESQFGESYRAYRRAVPRWGFTRRPYLEERAST